MINFFSIIKNMQENPLQGSSNAASDVQGEKEKVQTTTIPIVAQPTTTQAKLDSAGNIPLVVNTNADETMGLGIEKTTAVPSNTQPTTNKSKTETMDQFFCRYYTRYANADEAGKQKFIERYLSSLTTVEKQEKEFARLHAAGVDPKEIELLAKAIKVLNADNQEKAVDKVCNEGDEESRRAGRRVVAQDYHQYDKKVVKNVAKIIVETDDAEIINIAANQAHKTDSEVQVDVAKTFFNTGFEEVQNTIAANEGNYAKENQLEVYKTLMTSDFQSVLNLSASNIYTLHKDNQVGATKFTVATGNEEAINYAASNVYLCDKSVQAEVKSTLTESGYDSVKTTLEEASQTKTEESAKTNAVTKESFQKADVGQKIKILSSMNESDKKVYIKNMIKNASNAEKLALLSSLPASELATVIDEILNSNPSLDVLSKVKSLMDKVSDKDRAGLVKKLGSMQTSSILTINTKSLNPNMQIEFVKQMSAKDNLGNINKDQLSSVAKDFYNRLVKGQGKQ